MIALALLILSVALPARATREACLPSPEKPTGYESFVTTNDKTAGLTFSGILLDQTGMQSGYLPLNISRLEYSGSLEVNHKATLKLIGECAIIEMDLHLQTTKFGYQGRTSQLRVSIQDEKYTIDRGFLWFGSSNESSSEQHYCGYNSLALDPALGFNKIILIHKLTFIVESEDVEQLSHLGQPNNLGYQCDWSD